jgi:microcystin-dependent protein
MTITGSNTTSFGFQKLGSNDDAGYSTINEVVDGIDTILNASDRLIKASQTPTVAYVITGDGVDWVRGLVVTASITDLNVTTGKIADLAVTTGKIAGDAVTLGTKTSGDYVATITGTANEIASSAATSGEGTTHTLSLVSGATLPGAPTVATAVGSYPQSGTTSRVSTVQYVNDAVANVNASGSVALSGDVGGTAGATVIGASKVTSSMIVDNTVVLGDLATALQAFLVPTGTVSAFAGSSAPTGYLLCDGSAVSQTTYAALYAVVGANTYGTDGGGNFSLPNLKGRTVIGVGVGTEITGVLGTVQGVKEVTLTGAQSGTSAHGHPSSTVGTSITVTDPGHGHTNRVGIGSPGVTNSSDVLVRSNGGTQDGGFAATNANTTGITAALTSGALTIATSTAAAAASAHTNIQPSLPLN